MYKRQHKLREAVDAVSIEYEPLKPAMSIEESERQDPIVWGADNILKSFLLEKGDVDSAWATAAHIVEGEYRTGAQEHLYIENNGVIAEWSDESGITVWGSLQCPYYVHKSLLAVDVYKRQIRSSANREQLWGALESGLIDLVATDHSPCPPGMKGRDEGRFDRSWGGIASLGLALPVMNLSLIHISFW